MENGGIIRVELDEANAPLTCANFRKLVKEGFYDGLTFHRMRAPVTMLCWVFSSKK